MFWLRRINYVTMGPWTHSPFTEYKTIKHSQAESEECWKFNKRKEKQKYSCSISNQGVKCVKLNI